MASPIYCRYHPDAYIYEDPRGMVCSICGNTVGDRIVDVGSEWTTFNESTYDTSHIGPTDNSHFDTGMTTNVGRSTMQPEYHNRENIGGARTLMNAYSDINAYSEFADRAGIPKVIADQAQAYLKQNVVQGTEGWIDTKLRPLFAVDDHYVMKRIGLLIFPFGRRREFDGPDLYIPLMSFLTYVLAAGYMIGNPEQLGVLSSSALFCLGLEVCLLALILNIFNVKTTFTFLQKVAFCGYKFVPIIIAMLASLLFRRTGYLAVIAYSTLSLGYFTVKSYHQSIASHNEDNFDHKVSRTGVYIVGLFSLFQPLFMLWLSYHIVSF